MSQLEDRRAELRRAERLHPGRITGALALLMAGTAYVAAGLWLLGVWR